ncbi:MAG: hypothetical protein QW356_02135 [Candidatus Hadarchaeales archaeon]
MKYKTIHGLYTFSPTDWYYGHDEEGNVLASTTARELPEVEGVISVYPSGSNTLWYCPKCKEVHIYFPSDPLEFSMLERARDCEEYRKLKEMDYNFPRLTKKLVKGERTLRKEDFDYVVKRVEGARDLRLLEEYFDIPDELRARIVAKLL